MEKKLAKVEQIEKYDTKRAAAEIGIGLRAIYKWAEEGKIKYETFKRGCVQMRFYDAHEVERLKLERQNLIPVPIQKRSAAPAKQEDSGSTALVKPEFDTMNVVLSVLDKQQQAHEESLAQARKANDALLESLQTIVGQIMADKAAERQDKRERWEVAQKIDQERWEADRQDRLKKLERQSQIHLMPTTATANKAKARAAAGK